VNLRPAVTVLAALVLVACERGPSDATLAAHRTFLEGNASFAASEAAEARATAPGGDVRDREAALAHAEDALAAWRTAATSRADWPQARRNVERALIRVERLRRESARTTGERDRPPPRGDGPGDAPPDPSPPPPTPPPPPDIPADDRPTDVITTELAPADVLRVLDVLAEKERAKQALRRARVAAPTTGTEKDW
jgi:hypothetical protein